VWRRREHLRHAPRRDVRKSVARADGLTNRSAQSQARCWRTATELQAAGGIVVLVGHHKPPTPRQEAP
jgi:hypothetical protein